MSGLLCAGDIYVDRFDEAGNSTGLKWVGNATQCQIQESSEAVERTSKGRDTYGQLLDSVYVKQPAQLQMTLDEVDKDNLALALLGTVAAIEVEGGSVTDESVAAVTDGWVDLAERNVTAGTLVVSDDASATTYNEGVDYDVNLHLGMIRPKAGGGITAGDTLLVSYDHGGVQGATVAGGAKPIIRGRVMLDGKNLANGELVVLDIGDTTLTPTSAVDFLSDEFVPLEMEGRPRTPQGASSSYTVDVIKPTVSP